MSINSILITGSSGAVGTALIKELTDDYEIYAVDICENPWISIENEITADLTVKGELQNLPSDVDLIIHLAAHARVFKLIEQPDLARENLDMLFNLLEFSRENDISKFIFASSREIYGDGNKLITTENEAPIDSCENPYAASKISGEYLVRSYENCYGIDSLVLRFSNIYGKYDVSDRVIPLFISQAYHGDDLTIFGENKVLDFVYIDDCIQGIERSIQQFSKVKGESINIASGEGKSIEELAKLIISNVGSNAKVNIEVNRQGEVERFIADISKAQKVIQYRPNYSFEDGISAAIDWYLERTKILDEIYY